MSDENNNENEIKNIIYLDYNATTYIHPEVVKVMQPYLTKYFGNPSSSHIFGVTTKKAINKSREQIASMLKCSPSEIIFTSGGSESNNYSIKGVVYHYLHNNNNNSKFDIITSEIEHPSVLEVFKFLEATFPTQLNVIYLPVTNLGIIDINKFKSVLTKNCIFISIMHANNETGCLQPIKEICEIARKVNPNILIHSDASQSVGKVPVIVDNDNLPVDFLTICSHKFYGPKGIGCLYIKTGNEKYLEKIIHGANHEYNLRAGTENVLEIVGIGKAAELVEKELKNRMIKYAKCRNIIYKIIKNNVKNKCILQGPEIDLNEYDKINNNDDEYYKLLLKEQRLSNTLYISFPNLEANLILDLLNDKIACSAGAACHSEEIHMSYVLSSMNVKPEVAMGTLRISTGLDLNENKAEEAANYIIKTVNDLYQTKNNSNENDDDDVHDECIINNDISNVRLTKNTHGMGCGCKISPKVLNNLLKSLPTMPVIKNDKNILVSNESCDDACAYYLNTNNSTNSLNIHSNNLTLISSLDFLTPICDSPYDYGQIATANAISDIYAMGGKPINALTIVAFPISRLPIKVLEQILLGSLDKANEAECPILGGHSIEDNEPKFGLSVNGVCDKNFIWKNNNIKLGDKIIMTKKLGVGTIMTGVKKDIVKESKDECVKDAIRYMKMLNKNHCDAMRDLQKKINENNNNNNVINVIHACTDITGFGLIGHLKECLIGNDNLSINIDFNKVGFIDKSIEMVNMNVIPGGANNNYNYTKDSTIFSDNISMSERILINDPQTSGGLLFFVNKEFINDVVKEFEEKKLEYFIIGEVIQNKNENNKIYINK